jgi:hypothetical protein
VHAIDADQKYVLDFAATAATIFIALGRCSAN